MATDMWTYRPEVSDREMLLEGFEVDAADGKVGTIDEATYDVGESYIVVDTGFWIFGHKRLLPASSIVGIDLDRQKVQLALTRDQLRHAPTYDREVSFRNDPRYRDQLEGYYGQFPLM